MATQVQIAKEAGVHVSSVNKILHRIPGAVFKEETVKRVLSIAKRLGYKQNVISRYNLIRIAMRLAMSEAPEEFRIAAEELDDVLKHCNMARESAELQKYLTEKPR